MTIGPVEYILIAFPGNQFNGQIVPALQELVDSSTIHIIDLLFIKKDAEGNVLVIELNEVGDAEGAPFDNLDGEIDDLLSMEDIQLAAAELPNNTSAGLLVWENLWAARFASAVRAANGQVLANERIPHAIVEAAFQAHQADA
ncbi:MAG: hypothetical protein HGA45_16640 [Chloroflexales bacterium]|nr:hypothetical protein [Chloroflexales bacterium]